MVENAAVQDLLGGYLTVLQDAGSTYKLSPASSRDEVSKLLVQAGYDAREDVVEFFTWSGFVDRSWVGPDLFWGYNPVTLAHAIEIHRIQRDGVSDFWKSEGFSSDEAQWFPPGPDFFLPIAVLDSKDYVCVDCRAGDLGGSVWSQYSSDPTVELLFESLGEALEAARWSIETGVWTVDVNSQIECDRPFGPSTRDRDYPPFRTV